MKKKYIVELMKDKRSTLREVEEKLTGAIGKVKRANFLLNADAAGPGSTDARITPALSRNHRKRKNRLELKK